MQKIFNNNMVELNTLSNNDVERVNINKLKKYHHGETPTFIMTIIVNIKGRVKSVQKKNEHATPTNLPWTNCKTRPKELEPELWSKNDDMDEIEWLPSGKPRFKEVKTRKHKCMRTSKH